MNLGNPQGCTKTGKTVTYSLTLHPSASASHSFCSHTQMPTDLHTTPYPPTTNTTRNTCSLSLLKKKKKKAFPSPLRHSDKGNPDITITPGVNANQSGVLLFPRQGTVSFKFIRTSSTASLKNLLCHPLPSPDTSLKKKWLRSSFYS